MGEVERMGRLCRGCTCDSVNNLDERFERLLIFHKNIPVPHTVSVDSPLSVLARYYETSTDISFSGVL